MEHSGQLLLQIVEQIAILRNIYTPEEALLTYIDQAVPPRADDHKILAALSEHAERGASDLNIREIGIANQAGKVYRRCVTYGPIEFFRVANALTDAGLIDYGTDERYDAVFR
ncbi:hypothetical protein A9977_21090 [Variovorax sp. UMC13]|nr:hypothetical protein [Variovorax sp. UMC13]